MALCRDYPKDENCFAAAPIEPFFPVDMLLSFRMPSEWRLPQILGRDPLLALGDCPPWSECGVQDESSDASKPPVLHTVISADDGSPYLYQPVVVVGDNFVPGLTTVRFVGEGFDGFVTTGSWKRRVGSIIDNLPFGQYQVTAYNGSLASATITVSLE